MYFSSITLLIATHLPVVLTAAACRSADAYAAIDAEAFTVAAVRQPPVNFALPVGLNKTWVDLDLDATVDQAINTIAEAKADGVAFIAFPELYFPGYPVAINTAYTSEQIAQYVSQSMSINSTNFQRLVSALKDQGMYGEFGFSEIADNMIFMGQVLVGPDGTVLRHRRKLRPSGTERDIWSDGDMSGLTVTQTPHGRIGVHIVQPTMTFVMQAQAENIHVAAFPYAPDFGVDPAAWESAEVGAAAARAYAVNSGAYVIMPAVGTASIFGNDGSTLSIINATDSPDVNYITATLNTTAFSNATYDSDGEQSWAALQQIVAEFPSYIPKENSTFFAKKSIPIETIA